jgi:hypothetical protein
MTAPAAGGAAGSSSGYGDRGSLRTSQDISMLLRSGMLMEAALLSSNASRMHVIHDAGESRAGGRAGTGRVPTAVAQTGVLPVAPSMLSLCCTHTHQSRLLFILPPLDSMRLFSVLLQRLLLLWLLHGSCQEALQAAG